MEIINFTESENDSSVESIYYSCKSETASVIEGNNINAPIYELDKASSLAVDEMYLEGIAGVTQNPEMVHTIEPYSISISNVDFSNSLGGTEPNIYMEFQKMHIECERLDLEYPLKCRESFAEYSKNEDIQSDNQLGNCWQNIDVQTLFDNKYLDLKDYLISLSKNTSVIHTKLDLVISNIIKPIGISMLSNGNLVIGERGFRNSVGIFNPATGDRITVLESEREFFNASDMVTLPNGNLVVRDDLGLQLFDCDGLFINAISLFGVEKLNGVCYGIKCDKEGNLVTINTNPNGEWDCITRQGETDVLVIDVAKNMIVEKIELSQIITEPLKSKCRFLECDGDKIYTVDLGLNQVYVINRPDASVKKIGRTGFGPGQFRDAAGIAVDSAGNIVVSDAGNNRLQVFDSNRNFIGFVKLDYQISRPSGIYLDKHGKFLYILNLKGNSLVKLAILKV